MRKKSTMLTFAAFLSAFVSTMPAVSAETLTPDAATMKIGEREYFTKCFACHSLGEGEGHKIGPNLWGTFDAKAGTRAGFAYSDALKKSDIVWSSVNMDKWLASPSAVVPGNLMAFGGLPNEQDRRALVMYLRAKTGAKPK